MPQLLRHIKPSGKKRELAPPRIHRIDPTHNNAGKVNGIPARGKVPRSSTADSLHQLRGIRDEVEELLLLGSASDCLRSVGRTDDESRKKYKAEAKKVVVRLRKLLGVKMEAMTPNSEAERMRAAKADDLSPRQSAKPLTKRRAGTSRIQIRLTKALVRILTAFSEAGQKPSGLVERVLWKDQDIQDAARILGVDRLTPQSSHRPSPVPTREKSAATNV
ncbi:MAG: hypothetical protein P8J37_15320 [Fuerstiella sp.]|jgi:hypothetical protein|nr:hypothetical protein [Fuerstiella sp.]